MGADDTSGTGRFANSSSVVKSSRRRRAQNRIPRPLASSVSSFLSVYNISVIGSR